MLYQENQLVDFNSQGWAVQEILFVDLLQRLSIFISAIFRRPFQPRGLTEISVTRKNQAGISPLRTLGDPIRRQQ